MRPAACIARIAHRRGEVLALGQTEIDLSQVGRLYLVGAGKASAAMAAAVENLVGDLVTAGRICVKYDHGDLGGSDPPGPSDPVTNGNIWVNPGEIPGNGVDDDGNSYVDDVYGWDFERDNNTVYDGKQDDHGRGVPQCKPQQVGVRPLQTTKQQRVAFLLKKVRLR